MSCMKRRAGRSVGRVQLEEKEGRNDVIIFSSQTLQKNNLKRKTQKGKLKTQRLVELTQGRYSGTYRVSTIRLECTKS